MTSKQEGCSAALPCFKDLSFKEPPLFIKILQSYGAFQNYI